MKTIIIILSLVLMAYADIKQRAIDFVIKHEGGYHVWAGVEYNFGLSNKYFGHPVTGEVKDLNEKQARKILDSLWYASGADKVLDTLMAFVYYDTYILFNPTTAKQLLVSCYGCDEFLMRRLQEHVNKSKPCKECSPEEQAKRKARRAMMYGYVKRISDLRDEIAK